MPSFSKAKRPLRLGYLALTDAAPIAVACEHGLFEKHGIDVELTREVGWATIREKIIYGELDAAHAPAPMLWSTRLGIDSVACPVLTALVLNLNGNALTLSNTLRQAGVTDLPSLKAEARRRSGERKLTFGVVFNFSTHHMMLRTWLRSGGINPDKDVRIVVVPPAQMFRNLSAGTIDGYCAGEPYTSLAVSEGIGWCPALSSDLQPGMVEKVLMVTERFAFQHGAEHAALVSALVEACRWCDVPENRPALASLLAQSSWVGLPEKILLPALTGRFDPGAGSLRSVSNFMIFHRDGANAPTFSSALALQKELVDAALLPKSVERELPHQVFREDLYRQALSTHPTELVS